MAISDAEIGRLTRADLADANALVAEAGWNQTVDDWRIFLDCGTTYAVRCQGRVVATAAWLPYGGRCAWISMVLVTAAERRRGLATRLLHRCIADVTAAGLVPVLDATPAGRTVYKPLGFEASWGFARLASQRRVGNLVTAGSTIEPITDAAWPAVLAYDAFVFGTDRSQVVARLRGRLPAANLIARRDGGIVGVLLGRDGRTAAHLGPLIAEDDETAIALLAHALTALSGTVYVDVAGAKSGVRAWLETIGFSMQRPFTRMLLGRAQSFDDVTRTFAVIGPEFG
jgi:GNAT superfamily N-acetyltransferase